MNIAVEQTVNYKLINYNISKITLKKSGLWNKTKHVKAAYRIVRL
jgi:hypothetical protein